MPAHTPWYVATTQTVSTSSPQTNWTAYFPNMLPPDVATAADTPASYARAGNSNGLVGASTQKPLPGSSGWTFTEGVALFDARSLVTAGAPGSGGETEPLPPNYLYTEYEVGAGTFTGRARCGFSFNAQLNGDRDDGGSGLPGSGSPQVYTGWYDGSAHLDARNLAGWTTGADDFGDSSAVLFTSGWQSGTTLGGMTRVLHAPLTDFDTNGLMEPAWGTLATAIGDFFTVNLADARVALALHTDWQAAHYDMGLPALSGSPAAVRALNVFLRTATIQLEYQPPRYRYVVSSLPPLRQYPRNDGLGGTPRQGKANGSTSVQASARQGWRNTYR